MIVNYMIHFDDPSIWTQNRSYQESSAVGASYADMMIGGGTRIAINEAMIECPAETFTVSYNEGFQFSLLAFDENKEYLGRQKGGLCIWQNYKTFTTQAKYIVLLLKRTSGTLLAKDLVEAGLSIEWEADIPEGGVAK